MSLDDIQKEIEELYINMEHEILINIANKLAQGKPMEIDKWSLETNSPIIGSGGVNEWQLERLKELNGLNEENARIIAKFSGKTIEEINKIFDRAREIGTEIDKEMLDLGIKAGVLNETNPRYEDEILKNIISTAKKTTLTTLNTVNNSLLSSAGDNYKKIVNEVTTQVLSGAKTTAKAMQESVTKLAEKGLTSFTARNGAEWSSEAYIKMLIRANTQNTINKIQEERLKLHGCDYVEISSHIGARPLCSKDQGQIFSLSGNIKPIIDGLGRTIKVRSWSSSSYGQPAGILGINCGHTRYGFTPGISIKRKMNFTKEENDRFYIENQQQRLYERSIRSKKREIEMLKTTGAENNYIKRRRQQLSDYRKQYLDFLDRTGRTRISTNEWINKTSPSEKNEDKVNKKYQNWKEKEDRKIIKKSIIGKFNISKYTDAIKTSTKEVVLFEERIEHIKKRHPEVEKYIKDISTIVNKPDMVLQETKRNDTIWLIKTFDKNVKVTLKLNTTNDKKIKNSIIQMQFMRDSEVRRNIKNDKVIILFDKNNKE